MNSLLPIAATVLTSSAVCFLLAGCAAISTTYDVTRGTVVGGASVVKGTYNFTKGTTKAAYRGITGTYDLAADTTKTVYKIGEFSFEVVRARQLMHNRREICVAAMNRAARRRVSSPARRR